MLLLWLLFFFKVSLICFQKCLPKLIPIENILQHYLTTSNDYNGYVICCPNGAFSFMNYEENDIWIPRCDVVFSQLPSVQFSSVAQLCPTFCDHMNSSMPGLPVHHQLLEFTQTHAHGVSDAIQLPHPLSSPSPPALSLSHYQGVLQWVSFLHQVAKVLEFQLQHQSF